MTSSISTVHHDIIQTHILTKLDGPTLASTACTSPIMHTLCTEQKLWQHICSSTWHSINDSYIRHVISTFPAGYRSFFSDSYPTSFHHSNTNRFKFKTSELISAVDLKYGNDVVCSKIEVTETVTNAFLAPPFWIELFGGKETVQTPVKFRTGEDEEFLKDLEGSMSLSWIMIDPIRKRCANFSSIRPVSVRRRTAVDEVELVYATVLPGCDWVGLSDPVQCKVVVTCGGEEGGDMHVREVNMQVQDMDGINLSGEESLVILQGAMGSERRKGGERHDEFLKMMRERKMMREMRERRFDVIFRSVIGVVIFIGLLSGHLAY